MLGFWGGFYETWELRHKVTWDGHNKEILINPGVTELDVQVDLYSAWKQWSLVNESVDSRAFPQAMSTVGGDPTVGTNKLGSTFFLENGWKIRPWSGNYRLNVTGNLFSRDGLNSFLPSFGDSNVLINLTVSSIVQSVGTEPSEIAQALLNTDLDSFPEGSLGAAINAIKRNTGLIPGIL